MDMVAIKIDRLIARQTHAKSSSPTTLTTAECFNSISTVSRASEITTFFVANQITMRNATYANLQP